MERTCSELVVEPATRASMNCIRVSMGLGMRPSFTACYAMERMRPVFPLDIPTIASRAHGSMFVAYGIWFREYKGLTETPS
jgi:hypothetical protein